MSTWQLWALKSKGLARPQNTWGHAGRQTFNPEHIFTVNFTAACGPGFIKFMISCGLFACNGEVHPQSDRKFTRRLCTQRA